MCNNELVSDNVVDSSPAPTKPTAHTYYTVLGVDTDASEHEIKVKFHQLSRERPPDRPTGSAEAMSELSEAADVLRNPGRRRAYDTWLALPAAQQCTCGGHGGGSCNCGGAFLGSR